MRIAADGQADCGQRSQQHQRYGHQRHLVRQQQKHANNANGYQTANDGGERPQTADHRLQTSDDAFRLTVKK